MPSLVGRESNVNNVTCKASNEGPPCQAFEVPFAHRICSFPGGSSRLQVHMPDPLENKALSCYVPPAFLLYN
ncbi:hypothetical protein Q8A67_014949 [Cirrhinus molitorella]|uniref:Uncharacterized protein n=1 Tax=Cirrhinus molitorella TaxID=172907 RepID=A0AA88PHK0_9TELE|nr:hypothetical protein Q8A67_014949 [Cirrhinus molitorella]